MPKLFSEDQEKVDGFVHSNVNAVERKEFRPLFLLGCILGVLVVLTGLSFWIAQNHGVI